MLVAIEVTIFFCKIEALFNLFPYYDSLVNNHYKTHEVIEKCYQSNNTKNTRFGLNILEGLFMVSFFINFKTRFRNRTTNAVPIILRSTVYKKNAF